jgi:pimeloyl-ACP methyl ester carboxylesterase
MGRTVVLVHGSMDRASSFARLTSKLPDWTVVAYDRRGYAGSRQTGPPETFEQQVDDLLEVLDGEPAVTFGHSFGGDVVLAVAAQHPLLIPAALVWEPPPAMATVVALRHSGRRRRGRPGSGRAGRMVYAADGWRPDMGPPTVIDPGGAEG